jgi:hypothetical protein
MHKVQTKGQAKETKVAVKVRKIAGKDANDSVPAKKLRQEGSGLKSKAQYDNEDDDFSSEH